jgi:hypothetical protein
MSYYWTCGSGWIELEFQTLEQIQHCTTPSQDASDAVTSLTVEPFIGRQLSKWDREKLRLTLKEYGAWDDVELSNHVENIRRMLWIAANDVMEEPELYGEESELPQQFESVSSTYGAPMGRPDFCHNAEAEVHLFRVRMVDGDYDDGGAYWGGGDGPALYCARDTEGEVQTFVRAANILDAVSVLRASYPDLIVILKQED